MNPGDKPGPLTCPLGRAIPNNQDAESIKRRGWNEDKILVVDLLDPRVKPAEFHMLKNLGDRIYGAR